MEKTFRLFTAITLALGIISGLGIAWTLYQYNVHLESLLGGSPDAYTIISIYLILLLFHAGSFAIFIYHTLLMKTMRILKVALSAIGLVSFFAIAAQKVMIDEIAREGTASGEFLIVNICLLINMTFVVAMLAFLVRALHETHSTPITCAETEDILFVTGHALGVVSGFLGILLTISLLLRQVPMSQFWVYIPFYTMILAPYLLACIGWTFMKAGARATDWYDEKQWRDMQKSSSATILLAIAGMALLFVMGKPTGYYWFPYHISLTLLLFSTGTLFFYKRD